MSKIFVNKLQQSNRFTSVFGEKSCLPIFQFLQETISMQKRLKEKVKFYGKITLGTNLEVVWFIVNLSQ